MTLPSLYDHQEFMANFSLDHDIILNASSPGTGKTRGTLEGYVRRLRRGDNVGRLLVVCPLSIIKSSWADDIRRFTPLSYDIAHGTPQRRLAAFNSNAQVVLINHDGLKALTTKKGKTTVLKWPTLFDGFTDLVIDEFTAFKHRTTQRSKAALLVSSKFSHKTLLSGTPTANTVLDIWHPAFILDGGERLGRRFFKFRSEVCNPEQTGPLPEHVKWVDKPGAEEAVVDALSDISIRFNFEDVMDIPPNTLRFMYVDMPPKVARAYKDMLENKEVDTEDGRVSAINAAARATKLLQILSGAVYDGNSISHGIHDERYDLVMQLVDEREHSLVAFNWKHERNALCAKAEKMGISYACIDGSVPAKERPTIVENYQKGLYKVLFCHPQSAAHGLTLTRGTTTIWASPTYNPEHFKQFNQRIYRAGQTKSTETICIATRDTREDEAYKALNDKMFRMDNLLALLTDQTKVK